MKKFLLLILFILIIPFGIYADVGPLYVYVDNPNVKVGDKVYYVLSNVSQYNGTIEFDSNVLKFIDVEDISSDIVVNKSFDYQYDGNNKITISSNFGNMVSISVASLCLPFIPMAAVQQLLMNMIYDVSCVSLPFDNVDEEYIKIPRKWDASGLKRFMFWFAPTSWIFDIITFAVMFFIIGPKCIGGTYAQLANPGFNPDAQAFAYKIPEAIEILKRFPDAKINGSLEKRLPRKL